MIAPFKQVWAGMKWVGVHVAEGFKKLFGDQAAQDFAKASIGILKSAAGQIVLPIVEMLMNVPNLTGDEKRAQALKDAVTKLEQVGILLGKDIATSEINMLIEIAVAAVKGKFAPVVQ